MAEIIPSNYAIAWAQYRLRGGRSMAAITLGINSALALGALIVIPEIIGASQRVSYFDSLAHFLLGFQFFLCFVAVPSRIRLAVAADRTSNMVESHRLMPISAPDAVIGYLLGTPAMMYIVIAICVLTGACAAAFAGIATDRYFISAGLIASLGMLFGVFALSLGFIRHSVLTNIGMLVLSGFFVFPTSGWLFPSVRILNTPSMGNGVFSFTLCPTQGYMVALFAQLVLALMLFRIACRRFRPSPAEPGVTTTMGLLLLCLWLATAVIGNRRENWFMASWGGILIDQMRDICWVATCAVAMLILIAPIMTAAAQSRRRQILARLNFASLNLASHNFASVKLGRLIPPLWVALICSALTIGATLLAVRNITAGSLGEFAVVLTAFTVQVAALAPVAVRVKRGAILMGAWVIFWMAGPVIIATIVLANTPEIVKTSTTTVNGQTFNYPQVIDHDLNHGLPGIICTFSPSGAIGQIMTGGQSSRLPGEITEVLLAVSLLAMQYFALRSRTTSSPPSMSVNPKPISAPATSA